MKVFLDGNPVQYPNDALLYPKFTFRRTNNDGEKAISFSSGLEFTGADKDYIYNKLVLDPNAINNQVLLTFVDDCCGNKEYTFAIKPESLEWCETPLCENIKATAVEYSVESQQYACLKDTLIYDNHNGFQAQQHPRVTYCNEFRPAILQDAMIILLLICDSILLTLSPIIAVIAIIVTVINVIIAAVNLLGAGLTPIGGEGDIDGGVISWALNFFNQFNEFFIGCGRKHPSPFVRSYISNVCAKCGISFSSSIFNNPSSSRYNTMYFNAPVTKGVDRNDNTTFWIDKNKPLMNGTAFLDSLKPPVNGDWKIINGVLHFERRDWFVNTTPWLDLTTLDPRRIESVCYQWSQKPKYSYGNFQYSKDATDSIANEALDRWNDIVEWNSPYSPTQKGEFSLILQFGAARFRDDGIERDVLSSYSGWPLVGPVIQSFGNVMLMNGTAFQPKLLIYDDTTPLADARVRIYYPPGNTNAGLNQHYNYPYWFDPTSTGNLEDEFYAIENPRVTQNNGWEFEANIVFECTEQLAVNPDGVILTSHGPGLVSTIDVDFKTRRMTIKGTV